MPAGRGGLEAPLTTNSRVPVPPVCLLLPDAIGAYCDFIPNPKLYLFSIGILITHRTDSAAGRACNPSLLTISTSLRIQFKAGIRARLVALRVINQLEETREVCHSRLRYKTNRIRSRSWPSFIRFSSPPVSRRCCTKWCGSALSSPSTGPTLNRRPRWLRPSCWGSRWHVKDAGESLVDSPAL